MTSKPAAYRLASAQSRSIHERYRAVDAESQKAKRANQLETFVRFVEDGQVAINMPLKECIGVFETGRYFNLYELHEHRTGKKGKELLAEVRSASLWFDRRERVEKLLRFRQDAHYAALNLGGPGPVRYGDCCVLLGPHKSPEFTFTTCFAGDTLRVVFDSSGRQVLSDDDILALFSARDDFAKLAAVRHAATLINSPPGFDAAQLRGLLEDSDVLCEVHVHGPIRREDIRAVAMSRRRRDYYWDLAQRAEKHSEPWPPEYDPVPFFQKLTKLLDEYKVPFLVTENA